MNRTRRELLLSIGIALAAVPLNRLMATEQLISLPKKIIGNFRYIYTNETYQGEFFNFLVNVFHLYPEEKLHSLIKTLTEQDLTDQQVYRQLQEKLPEIKPFLADLTYALPALSKQKKEMADQTLHLLGNIKRYEGYLEIGSNGRYLDSLEEQLTIEGDCYFLNSITSTYSPVDMIDRGQLFKAGKDIDLNNYKSELNKHIKSGSIGLATVFIGFHHCPLNLREEFITSIRDAMSDKGRLIVRDHNVHNEKMWRMVALAHDVFNMGTQEAWSFNEAELRLFYSLDKMEAMMKTYGFKSDGRRLFQDGDPTLNALMVFQKA